MTGGNNPPVTAKAYGIVNIKNHVPLVLDLTTHNYDPWRELFTTHCIGFDVLDHIDDTFDPPKTPPADPEWQKIDALVKNWLYGSITQSLITSAYTSNATARKVWLNLEAVFRENKDAKAMQLETDLRSISMGDLSVHDYYNKIKHLADLLEGIGEKVQDRHLVIYTINGLSGKFDNLAGIIRHSRPLPTFAETRSMLHVEEQRLTSSRVPAPSHDQHSSSPTLLHIGTGPPHRGGSNGYRRNDRRGSHHHTSRRRPPGPDHSTQRYGWVYFPPPSETHPPRHHTRHPVGPSQWSHSNGPTHHRPTNHQSGLLGSRPNSNHHFQPNSQIPQAHFQSSSTPQPPWAWLGSPDQPTSLPNMFSSMSLNDPTNSDWNMDTGATDHVHANPDTPSPNPM